MLDDTAKGPPNATVIIIRHAEAPPKAPHVDPELPRGTFNPGLAPKGCARANAYAAYFKNCFARLCTSARADRPPDRSRCLRP